MVTMGSLKEVITGLLSGPVSHTLRPPLHPNWRLTTAGQSCITKIGQTVPVTLTMCDYCAVWNVFRLN